MLRGSILRNHSSKAIVVNYWSTNIQREREIRIERKWCNFQSTWRSNHSRTRSTCGRLVKHEVVYSKSQPGKVHIRCVETGTYWGWPEYGAAGNHNHNVCPHRTVRLIASSIGLMPTFQAPQKYRKIHISFKIIFWGVL